MNYQQQSVRINLWATAVQKLETLHQQIEQYRAAGGRIENNSLDLIWCYLLNIWLPRWRVRLHEDAIIPANRAIGYPVTELILDKRSNHLPTALYSDHLIEPTLRELSARLSYWINSPNRDLFVTMMLSELHSVLPQKIKITAN